LLVSFQYHCPFLQLAMGHKKQHSC
jgi:hypothetical protein